MEGHIFCLDGTIYWTSKEAAGAGKFFCSALSVTDGMPVRLTLVDVPQQVKDATISGERVEPIEDDWCIGGIS